MQRATSRSLVRAAALMLVVSACERSPSDDPPQITLPHGPQTNATTTLAADPAPPASPPRPVATALPAAPIPGPPLTAPTPVAFTPFTIPWPVVLPSSLPTIPGIFPPIFPPSPPPASPAPTPSSAPTGNHAQPIPDARVIVYGATWCSACSQLKQHLAARSVSYVFVDIEDRQAMASPAGVHAAEMPARMRNGIPVTRVAQKTGEPLWFQGDDPDRIERASR